MSTVKCASILDWKKRKSLSVNQSSNTRGQAFGTLAPETLTTETLALGTLAFGTIALKTLAIGTLVFGTLAQ